MFPLKTIDRRPKLSQDFKTKSRKDNNIDKVLQMVSKLTRVLYFMMLYISVNFE